MNQRSFRNAASAGLASMEIMPLLLTKAAAEVGNNRTNPINFAYDARLYDEHQWLNVPGIL